MSLGTFVSGRYSSTYNSNTLGIARAGYSLDFQFKDEALDETDAYGLSTIDLIRRGADCHLSAILKEWLTGSKAILWAIGGGTLGKIFTAAVPAGSFAYDSAQALVLTAVSNTTAATLGPATLTASKAYPAANYNPEILLDSRLREVPIRLILFPYASSSDTIAFSTT